MSEKVVLTVENGSLAGRQFVFKQRRVCVVGRAPDCDIWIPGDWEHRNVSRYHCLLDIDPPHVRVWDLGSRNGTRVNGLAIGKAGADHNGHDRFAGKGMALSTGDQLEVGHTLLRVEAASVPPSTFHDDVALDARIAADLMTPQVYTLPTTATVTDVTSFLTQKKIGAVLVTGALREPVGVVSRTDIVAHDFSSRSRFHPESIAGPFPSLEIPEDRNEDRNEDRPDSSPRASRAMDLMTPLVHSIPMDQPASTVIDTMLNLRVHRLFVTSPTGKIIGVVTMTDVLRHLHRHVGA